MRRSEFTELQLSVCLLHIYTYIFTLQRYLNVACQSVMSLVSSLVQHVVMCKDLRNVVDFPFKILNCFHFT